MSQKSDRTENLLRNAEFIAFDLETTGLHPMGAKILEIGAVRFRGDGTILGQFQQLVDPQCDIPEKLTEIHGISNQMVAGQPLISDVLPRFAEFVGDLPVLLLAHNARFDIGFLSVAFSRLGQVSPSHPVLDTCGLARRRLSLRNYKLETIGRHLDLICKEKHRALEDAMLLKSVFIHLVQAQPAVDYADELFKLATPLKFDCASDLDKPPAGFEDLWLAISEHEPVAMVYLGGRSPGATRIIAPLGVIQMRGHLYLSAFCHESECEKSFRLDRIASYKRTM